MLYLTLKHSLIFFVALIFAFNLFTVITLLYAFRGAVGPQWLEAAFVEQSQIGGYCVPVLHLLE